MSDSLFPPPDGTEDFESQIEDIERAANDPDSWPYGELTVRGSVIEIRKPMTNALHVLKMATSENVPKHVQNDMVTRYVKQHTSPASFEHMLERMIDPDDEFTLKDFGAVMRGISTHGTARPTVR